MLKETLQKVANASDTPIMQDKETQLQHWTDFVVNKVMPAVAKYDYITKSKYAFENSASMQHGNFSSLKLPQTEQLALLGADYALSKGINPLPVILGCVIKDLTEKYVEQNKYINDKRIPKTQEDFIQDSKNFLEQNQLNLTDKDKEQIINAVFFPEKSENADIIACINKAFQTRSSWENENTPEKEIYLKQQLNRLNKTDMPSYIQQHMVQGYTYEHSPMIGTKEHPIVFYHSTPMNLAKLVPVQTYAHGSGKKLYVSPDIRYTLEHCRGNKQVHEDTSERELVSINNSGLVDKKFYREYLVKEKHIDYTKVNQCLKENTSQSSIKEIDSAPFVYKGELVGLFPLETKSFKEQGIDLPMDRICHFMGIDYPIKDKKNFLRQSVKVVDEFRKTYDCRNDMQQYQKDLKKLKDFLEYVDVSENKHELQEKSREPYVQLAQGMIKTSIENLTPQELLNAIRSGARQDITLLIDGVKEIGALRQQDNPPHYAIFNPNAVKVTARYKLNGYNIAKVEKVNAEGHFGAITPREVEQTHPNKLPQIPQQMVAEIPQQSSSDEPPKVPKQSKLTPEQLAKNIHRYL